MMYRYAKVPRKDVTVENSNALDQFSDGEKLPIGQRSYDLGSGKWH